jgi:hypothetical protein
MVIVVFLLVLVAVCDEGIIAIGSPASIAIGKLFWDFLNLVDG